MTAAVREKFSIACVLYDLDHFKKINDNYGHDMGDTVLILFTNLIKKIKRKSDVFIRYGGEEFLVIMSHCSAEEALAQSTRVLTEFEKETHRLDIKGAVTCSAGISTYDSADSDLTAESLVDFADKALYQAKEQGRNRIVVF